MFLCGKVLLFLKIVLDYFIDYQFVICVIKNILKNIIFLLVNL